MKTEEGLICRVCKQGVLAKDAVEHVTWCRIRRARNWINNLKLAERVEVLKSFCGKCGYTLGVGHHVCVVPVFYSVGSMPALTPTTASFKIDDNPAEVWTICINEDHKKPCPGNHPGCKEKAMR